MKAITPAFALVALLGALLFVPGCGGQDEAAPPSTTGDVAAPGDAMEDQVADPNIEGAVDESTY